MIKVNKSEGKGKDNDKDKYTDKMEYKWNSNRN